MRAKTKEAMLSDGNRHIIDKISAEITGSLCDQRPEIHDDVKKAICLALQNIRKEFDKNYDDAYYRFGSLSIVLNIRKEDMPRLADKLQEQVIKNIEAAKSKADNNSLDETSGYKRIGNDDRVKELAVYFLKTGQFPWWAANESIEVIENWFNKISEEEWRSLSRILSDIQTNALKRLVLQFPKNTLNRLIILSSDASQAEKIISLLDEIKQFLDSKSLAFGQSHQIILNLYRVVFERLIEGKTGSDLIPVLAFEFIHSSIEMTKCSQEDIMQSWKDWLEESGAKQKSDWIRSSIEVSIEPKVRAGISEEPAYNKSCSTSVDSIEMTVKNAGLVLLHPFIERLFENIGLLNGHHFESERMRERAVCILHYLATGREDFAEPELMMPKFICDLPFGAPVSRFSAISNYEKAECVALLESVITNWEAPKALCVESLGDYFLQRRGVLEKSDGRWILYMEEKPQDSWLEGLPWNVSVLKHEWSDEELTTYW